MGVQPLQNGRHPAYAILLCLTVLAFAVRGDPPLPEYEEALVPETSVLAKDAAAELIERAGAQGSIEESELAQSLVGKGSRRRAPPPPGSFLGCKLDKQGCTFDWDCCKGVEDCRWGDLICGTKSVGLTGGTKGVCMCKYSYHRRR